MDTSDDTLTAFSGHRRLGRGAICDIVALLHPLQDQAVVILNDRTGARVEVDLRGELQDALARAQPPTPPKAARGRPRLGVTAREVTLLPRHWDWLAAQPSGASATLRRLVDDARRDRTDAASARATRDATYRVMTILGGDLPNYEEATRALFAGDAGLLTRLIGSWPEDFRTYVAAFIAPPST